MSVVMQWNLPADAGVIAYTAPSLSEDDVHGLRMSNGPTAWIGEDLVIYGSKQALEDWHAKAGAVIAAIPDPEPRFVFADIPPHCGVDECEACQTVPFATEISEARGER